MKKNTLTILALIISLCALIFSCIANARLNARIATLETYTASLVAQVQQLAGRNESFFSTSGDAVSTSLVVESWTSTADTLTITGGYAQVQLPQVAASAPETCLILMLNGQIHKTAPLDLAADGSGVCFEAELRDIAFSLPELTDDDLLELWIDVNIDGKIHSNPAAEWYLENGRLMMSAG